MYESRTCGWTNGTAAVGADDRLAAGWLSAVDVAAHSSSVLQNNLFMY